MFFENSFLSSASYKIVNFPNNMRKYKLLVIIYSSEKPNSF